MAGRFQHDVSTPPASGPTIGTPSPGRIMGQLRALTNDHLRSLAVLPQHRAPAPSRAIAGPTDGPRSAPGVRLPRSHVVRSACGLTGFLGLLSFDGTPLEANETASTPPELSLRDTIGHPFWEATWWSWSPAVRQRLRETVARVGGGAVLRYDETALVKGDRLITVDLAWAPVVRGGSVTALICSVIDITGHRAADPGTAS